MGERADQEQLLRKLDFILDRIYASDDRIGERLRTIEYSTHQIRYDIFKERILACVGMTVAFICGYIMGWSPKA